MIITAIFIGVLAITIANTRTGVYWLLLAVNSLWIWVVVYSLGMEVGASSWEWPSSLTVGEDWSWWVVVFLVPFVLAAIVTIKKIVWYARNSWAN